LSSTIRMICLANSRKIGGRCVAGIDVNTGEWVRPVRDNGGALTFRDIKYKDGSIPGVLDIVDVPVLERQPLYYQPENWVIDSEYYWDKIGQLPVNQLFRYCENSPYIFGNGRDRLSEDEAMSMQDPRSLILIEAKDVCFEKRWPVVGQYPQLRAIFEYNRIFYDLVVTDVSLENKFKGRAVDIGEYPKKGNFLLTISLGELFKGYHYKLVASVICLDRTKSKILDIKP